MSQPSDSCGRHVTCADAIINTPPTRLPESAERHREWNAEPRVLRRMERPVYGLPSASTACKYAASPDKQPAWWGFSRAVGSEGDRGGGALAVQAREE